MTLSNDASPELVHGINPIFLRKIFISFTLLALAAAAISLGGKYYGRSIAMGGHTDSTTPRQVVIGNNLIVASENSIRFPEARRDGITNRLEVYLHWPEMTGYSANLKDDFNHVGGTHRIIFVTFEEKSMSRDMSGRYDPIYEALIAKPGKPGKNGLTYYAFSQQSGYMNEELVVAQRSEDAPFVARCMTTESAAESLAPCARDIQIGDNLSLTYRFPRELLEKWPALEAAIRTKAVSMLHSTRPR